MLGVGRLLVLVVLAAVLLNLIQNASATEYTCNSCSDCSTKIQAASSGDTIRLTASISYYNDSCILFGGKDNVVFDCGGNTINGSKCYGECGYYGVYLDNSDDGSNNNTIRNCVLTGFDIGINIVYSSNNTVTNVTAKLNRDGLYIGESNRTNLTNVITEDNEWYDIDLNFWGGDTVCTTIIDNATGYGGRPIRYLNSSTNLSNEIVAELILCDADNSNITNVTVIGSTTFKNNGVSVTNTENSNFTGINSSYRGGGFGIYSSSNIRVANSIINSNSWSGLSIYTSSGNIITNVTTKDNEGGGIYLFMSYDNALENVITEENSYTDLDVYASDNSHCNNILTNVTGYGGRPARFYNSSAGVSNETVSTLVLCNADNINLENITVIGSTSLKNNGVKIYFTENAALSMINSSSRASGLWMHSSSNNTITNLIANNNSYDTVTLYNSSVNRLANVAANYNEGYCDYDYYYSSCIITMGYDAGNNTLTNITASFNNGTGICISSSNNTLTNITASSNCQGIMIYDGWPSASNYNTIKNSRIENNTQNGIYLSYRYYSSPLIRYNTFYNNFLNNTVNVYSDHDLNGNDWNTTLNCSAGPNIIGQPCVGGNFWTDPDGYNFSNYCNDADGNGVCDSSYTAATNNTDYLPLSDNYMILQINNCTVLGSTGWTYNLTQDITNSANTTCINVTADNVTLNCEGRKIDGTSASDTYGVYMKERKNITVRNCTITDWWYGVFMNVTIRSNVSGNNLTNNNIGVETLNSLNNTMHDNFVKSTGTAIYLSNSSYNSIARNTIKNGDVGISLASVSRNNTFTGNSLDSLNNYAVYIYQSYDNFFRDSNITSTSTNIYHFASTDTVFLNVSLDKSKITVDAGTIYLKWYLDARIVSEEGAVNQANATIKDAYNTTVFSGAANASGYITRQNATEFHQNFSGKFYYNNHVIKASRFGYVQNQTSANVTANQLVILYLPGIAPPLVQVRTYTLGMTETDIIKPGRIVRIRANVNHTLGREYIMNSTLAIKDNTGSLVLNNAAMANISSITNGYTYEYNYTIVNGSEGLWVVNVTAADSFGRKGSSFKKIAVIPLTLQIKLVLNSTSDSIYIPGTGETSFSGLATAEYASPEHYYLASYSGDALKAVVFSHLNPIALLTEKNADSYAIGTSQRFSSSMVFLAFSKGNWRIVNNRMSQIEKGEFLSAPEPSFGFGLGNKYPLKVFLNYQDIDINSTLVIGRGYNRLVIEKTGSTGAEARINIKRG